jgi:hypothetical protein
MKGGGEGFKVTKSMHAARRPNVNVGCCRRLIHVHGRLYITLHGEEETGKVAKHETSNYVVIPAPSFDPASQSKDKSKGTFHPPSLTEIYKFDEMAQIFSRRNPTQKLIFSAGSELLVRVRTSFLVGCHAMISHGMDFESVFSAFEKLHELFGLVSSTEEAGSSIWISMSAVFQAKQLNWIDFKETFEMTSVKPSTILMEEYLHYARYGAENINSIFSFCFWAEL